MAIANRTCVACNSTFTPNSGRQMWCRNPCAPGPFARSTCKCCAAQYVKDPRWNNGYCSTLCRNYARGGVLSSRLPASHWARWYGASSDWKPPVDQTRNTGECAWCGGENARDVTAAYCTDNCKRRAKNARRRAAEHGAPGLYRYSEVATQYRKQGSVCAYCQNPVLGLPDPEHVVPLSRGGRNDMTNIVAACRPCNSDKRDLLLTEWSADRAKRGKQPVRTDLAGDMFPRIALTH